MTLVLIAQTLEEITAQVVAGLRHGYSVELDNHYRFAPVDWLGKYPQLARAREELAALGERVIGEWGPARHTSTPFSSDHQKGI